MARIKARCAGLERNDRERELLEKDVRPRVGRLRLAIGTVSAIYFDSGTEARRPNGRASSGRHSSRSADDPRSPGSSRSRGRSYCCCARRGACTHANTRRTAERTGSTHAARSPDESRHLGLGPHRALRGAVAHAQSRRPDRVRRDAGDVQSVRVSSSRARNARAADAGRMSLVDGRDSRARSRAPPNGGLRGREHAAARWLRVRDGRAARVPTQRNHPPDAAVEAGRALSRAARDPHARRFADRA